MTDWCEPTPRVRWGNPRWRYGVGLVLIVLGATATTLTSTYSLWFLWLGPLVQLLGWLVLPGALWRRLVVALPCLLAALVLLAGPDFVGAFAVLLAGWLFARHRPALSFVVVLPVIVMSFVLKAALNEYGQNWVGLLIGALVTVLCAWLGRTLAVRRWRRLAAQGDAADGGATHPPGRATAPATVGAASAPGHPTDPE